jgi:hypothetical protein
MTQFAAVNVGTIQIVEGEAEYASTPMAVLVSTVLTVDSALVGVLVSYWGLNLKNGLAG